jgi:hypothetical protein
MSLTHVRYDVLKSNKYPILITLVFFIITIYVAFGVHNYWTFDYDGIQYLSAGKEVLKGNGENVGFISDSNIESTSN